MVYGANGFSGRAIAVRLAEAGHDVLLAGRHSRRVEALARSLGRPWRVFDLRDQERIRQGLAGVKVVLSAAGPFLTTAGPMMEACVGVGVHYLDLAGEWPVFALAQRLGPEAEAAKVMLMPGAGSTIVVSDCLLARAAAAAPQARVLRVIDAFPGVVSRGTLRSALGLVAGGVIVRRAGAVERIAGGGPPRWYSFGDGERACMPISGPDVITGQHTTGVANIEAYLEARVGCRAALWLGELAADLCGETAFRTAGAALIATWPERPAESAQRQADVAVVVEAEDPWRRVTRFGVRTLDGYTVSTDTAASIVARVVAGDHPPGFQTPAGVFGANLIVGLASVWPFDASPLAPPTPRRS